MGVQFVGSMPEPRKSILSPLAEQASKYSEFLRTSKHESGEREKDRQFQSAENAKTRQATLQSELLKFELDTKDKNLKHVRNAVQNLSNKSKEDQDIFLNSDAGKELTKFAKGVDKSLTDDQGKLILLPSNKNLTLAQLPPEKRLEYEKALATMKAEVKAGQPPSLDTIIKLGNILSMMKPDVYKKLLKDVEEVQRNLMSRGTKGNAPNPLQSQNPATNALNMYSKGLAQPVATQPTAVNEDPLGLFK